MISNHVAKTKAQWTRLDEKHEQELTDFDDNTPEDLAPLFRRNSVTYLKMRSKEKNLANTTHVNEAIALQAKANVLEQQEREAYFEPMDRYYSHKKRRLKERQERTFDGCAEYAIIRREEMIHARDKSILGQQNRIENFEKAIVFKCEQRGMKQSQINLDLVDEKRVELIRSRENDNPVSNKRAASAMTQGAVPITTPKQNSRRIGTTNGKSSSQGDRLTKLPDLVDERKDKTEDPPPTA
jgi:hypothetical protein